MNPTQRHLIRKSFSFVEQRAEVAALVFYRRLFELAPEVRPMFKTDILEQSKKLMDTLAAALARLDLPAELTSDLEELGAKHVEYGVKAEHYPVVRRALLGMLQEVLGDAYTPELHAAWDGLYDFIETAMLRGAAAAPAADRPSSPHA